jgi:hypothetical protein
MSHRYYKTDVSVTVTRFFDRLRMTLSLYTLPHAA